MKKTASEDTSSSLFQRGGVAINIFGRYMSRSHPIRSAKKGWDSLGPGLVTGAADDDPSGIATYSQTGAGYGFSYLWLALYTFPLMSIVQEMCARIALVTKKGLAKNIAERYPRRVLYVLVLLLAIANITNIGADIGAMAAASRLIVPAIPQAAFVLAYGILILLLEIYLSYREYARYLKWLALVTLSYVASAVLAHIPWKEALQSTLVPVFHKTRESLLIVTAVLGTTISPYLFFWQSSQEVEEKGSHSAEEVAPSAMRAMRIDVWVGMLLSNVVMFAIIAVGGAVLHTHGINEITTADQAALALRPFAGQFSYILFAVGIVGTGMLAVPILAGSLSYALAETFGWKQGLNKKLHQARAFYGAIILSVGLGLLMNFFGLDPIRALIASAVMNGLVAPVMLFFILRMSGSAEVMGEHKNRPVSKLFGWLLFVLMTAAAVATLVSVF